MNLEMTAQQKEAMEKFERIKVGALFMKMGTGKTIRHNRARGTHSIELMTGIVADLKKSGMSDSWIMKNIGMDAEELLRLKQLSGLQELFKDKEFSKAWIPEGDK